MLKKSLVAVALGATITASLPVMATTWGGSGSPAPITLSGTLMAFSLPGGWEWAVGGKVDFLVDTATNPMSNNNKTLTIVMADTLPILAGRMSHPRLGGSRANIAVSFPDVVTGGATYPGSKLDKGGRALGLTVNAPITLNGADANVVGYAIFNATGAGVVYDMPTAVTPAVAANIATRAVAPTGPNHLCAGLVGNVVDDNAAAFQGAATWLALMDPVWVRPDADTVTLFGDAARIINPALPVNQPAAQINPASLAKLAGLNSDANHLVMAQCGLGVKDSDTMVLNFNNTINTETNWVVKVSPVVTYN